MTTKVTKSIIVDQQTPRVYDLWASFESFPSFMEHISAVERTGSDTTRWTMQGPLNTTITWEAKTTALEPYQRIAWSSQDNPGDIKTSGQVTFTELPHNQTEVTVTLQYVPPAGIAGEAAAALFTNPAGQLDTDLKNFKKLAETVTKQPL